jgi:transposase InsO family protein
MSSAPGEPDHIERPDAGQRSEDLLGLIHAPHGCGHKGPQLRAQLRLIHTSPLYWAESEKYQMEVSMSRKEECWDNAVAESFFGTFETEWMKKADGLVGARPESRSGIGFTTATTPSGCNAQTSFKVQTAKNSPSMRHIAVLRDPLSVDG